ncbi:MAG: gliding motility-associated C-terminal domain-containing protein [Bacteroidota bacterium]
MRIMTALTLRKLLLTCVMALAITRVSAQNVYTVAGMAGISGSSNGQGTSASFNNPYGVASDSQGNLYVANRFGNTIRKIDPSGNVTTYAGTGTPGATDGAASTATFNEPWGVTCDSLGNVYVADTRNYKIRKISASGQVTTVAGIGTSGVTNGIAALAQFSYPTGITTTPNGSIIYVSDQMTHTIRKIENGQVSTFAGTSYSIGSNDGQGLMAKFYNPNGLAIDAAGYIYVADESNHKIRKITPSGLVSTIAGNGSVGSTNGPALQASFNRPWGVCVLETGDLLVSDSDNFTIRKISAGMVSLYAGQTGIPGMTNGPVLQATFNGVSALCLNKANHQVYLCDPYSHLVRKIAPMMLTLSTSGNSFCAGSNVIIQVTPTGLSNYKLFANGVLAATSANGVFSISTLPQGQHTLTATASGTNGSTILSDPISINITQGLSISVLVGGSNTICMGDTVTLSSSIQGTYQWSNGANTPSIQVTNAGTYSVTVTNAQGCSGTSAAQQIMTLQPPAATISSISSAPNCPGDTVVLTAGQAPQYLWSNGATTQSISVTNAGSFTVLVSNAAGCSATSMAMTVNYHPVTNSTITPSGNVLVVQGSQATLTAGSGTAYLWSTGSVSQSISVSTAGTYTVTITDNNGCVSNPASVNVSYLSANNLVSTQGATSFCKGDSVLLTSAFNSYNQWYRNGSPIAGATANTYTAKQSGAYQLRYAPPSSTAVFSDTIQVEVMALPNTLNVIANGVCPFSSSTIEIVPVTGISYAWYNEPQGGSLVQVGNSYTTPVLEETTSYYVLQTNSYGCVAEQTIEIVATVFDVPEADFSYAAASSNASGYLVSFESDNVVGVTYDWDFGDIGSANNNSTLPAPDHVYPNTGIYRVTCIATNSTGCSDTTEMDVRVALPDNIFIPNSFTPDNDGQNDLFRVRGNNILYADMSVFDQWGKNIWNAEKTETGWDGQSPKGYVPVGTYNYAVKVYLDNGATSYHRGSINLIR